MVATNSSRVVEALRDYDSRTPTAAPSTPDIHAGAVPTVTAVPSLRLRHRAQRGVQVFGIRASLDLVALAAAWGAALFIHFALISTPMRVGAELRTFSDRVSQHLPVAIASLGLFLAIGLLNGNYSRTISSTWVRCVEASRTLGITSLFVVLTTFLAQTGVEYSRLTVAFSWILGILFLCLSQVAAQRVVSKLHLERLRTVILAGDGESAEAAMRLPGIETSHFEHLGVVTMARAANEGELPALLGSFKDLEKIVRDTEAEAALVVFSSEQRDVAQEEVLAKCQALFPAVYLETGLQHLATAHAHVHSVQSRVVLELRHDYNSIAARWKKRTFDILFSSAVIILLLPVFLSIWSALRLQSRAPTIFKQARIGLGGREFHMFKFRTMVPDADRRLGEILAKDPEAAREFEATFKLQHDPRVTRIGGFLRKTSLDELPQFFNVLRGEMSVVGPRPIFAKQYARYGTWGPNLLAFRPGITGHWQVSGRSNTTHEQRVALDMHYQRNWSWSEDMRIVLKTVRMMIATDNGAY